MKSRTFRLAMLAFTMLWFGVVLPGHERGAITVPGSASDAGCNACETQSHCAIDDSQPIEPNKKSPTDEPTSPCAICKFIGTLDVPVVFDLTPPATVLLADLDWSAPASRCDPRPTTLHSGRAPPLFS